MKKHFQRNFEEIKEIVAFTDEFFAQSDIDPALRNVVDLCLEELFVNMVSYNRETTDDILIELYPQESGVRASLTDYNVQRFDPRRAPAPDTTAPLEDRSPGGLGLYLVMKMVDAIHYEYRDRTSKITFVKHGPDEHV